MKRFHTLGFLWSLVGCSSFEKDWQAAAAAPADASRPLLGRWQGGWKSEATVHSGGLRALITSEGPDRYRARYRATYGCCFRFEYAVPLTAVEEGDLLRFEGNADLGWLAGGTYQYKGQAAQGKFTSAYSSKKDHGLFSMERVPEGTAPGG
jgi:hypothetical protein